MQKLEVLSQILFFVCLLSTGVLTQGKNHKILKCIVCEKIFEEVEKEINNPNIKKTKIAVGGYHLDDSGDTNQRVVPYHQSDIFLNEVLDNVCEKMKDYVRARSKSDNKLLILPLVLPGGAMNPQMSEVNPIFDDDLNKSLGHYCQEIINEYEEEIIDRLKRSFTENKEESSFCSITAPYCSGVEEFEDIEELPPSLDDLIHGEKDEF